MNGVRRTCSVWIELGVNACGKRARIGLRPIEPERTGAEAKALSTNDGISLYARVGTYPNTMSEGGIRENALHRAEDEAVTWITVAERYRYVTQQPSYAS